MDPCRRRGHRHQDHRHHRLPDRLFLCLGVFLSLFLNPVLCQQIYLCVRIFHFLPKNAELVAKQVAALVALQAEQLADFYLSLFRSLYRLSHGKPAAAQTEGQQGKQASEGKKQQGEEAKRKRKKKKKQKAGKEGQQQKQQGAELPKHQPCPVPVLLGHPSLSSNAVNLQHDHDHLVISRCRLLDPETVPNSCALNLLLAN